MARQKKYLNNNDLLAQFLLSREQEKMTDEFAKMLMTLVFRYAKRGNFVNYTYRDDMEAFAIMELVRHWQGYTPEKNKNAFAYFTTCVHNSFLQFLNKEQAQRNIRDSMLVYQGELPSYKAQDEWASDLYVGDNSPSEVTTIDESENE